jgi:hypothetical protein
MSRLIKGVDATLRSEPLMPTTAIKRIGGTASGGATLRVTATPAGGNTSRVSAAPTGTPTDRVSELPWTVPTARIGFLLALEGDESGSTLLLEGDEQDDDYAQNALRLEGDMATLGGTTTKRVPEAVT